MNKCKETFWELIVSEPNRAFPSGIETNYEYLLDLKDYLEIFFYKDLEDITKKLGKNKEWLYNLRVNTYCYLLDAKGYSEDDLISCLTKAEIEDIINHITIDDFEIGVDQLQEMNNADVTANLIAALFESWCNLEELVSIYYSKIIQYHKRERLKIERIIVFEAPPFCGIKKLDHFFINGGNYLTSFTFNQVFTLKIKNVKLDNLFQLNLPYYNNKRKQYKIFKNPERNRKLMEIKNNIEKAINSGIVYIDLSMIPLPITSNIRREWSTNKKYLFGNQQLPVLMLEWALKKLKSRFETAGIKNPFSRTCQIAIGTPINTSSSIFEYYSDKLLKIDTDVYFDLSTVNFPDVFKKKPYLKGYTLKQFKFNVIDNTTPTEKFVKNAFDFPK